MARGLLNEILCNPTGKEGKTLPKVLNLLKLVTSTRCHLSFAIVVCATSQELTPRFLNYQPRKGRASARRFSSAP
jgi:hypothetical protein